MRRALCRCQRMHMRSQTECMSCLQVGLWVHGLHARGGSKGQTAQGALLPRNAGMPKAHPLRRGKSTNFITTVLVGLAAFSLLVSFSWMHQSKDSYHHQSDLPRTIAPEVFDRKESYHNRTHSSLPGRNSSKLKPAAEEIQDMLQKQLGVQAARGPVPPPPPPFSQFPITLEDLVRLKGTWEASERSKTRCLSVSVRREVRFIQMKSKILL